MRCLKLNREWNEPDKLQKDPDYDMGPKHEMDLITKTIVYFIVWMVTLGITAVVAMGVVKLHQVWF